MCPKPHRTHHKRHTRVGARESRGWRASKCISCLLRSVARDALRIRRGLDSFGWRAGRARPSPAVSLAALKPLPVCPHDAGGAIAPPAYAGAKCYLLRGGLGGPGLGLDVLDDCAPSAALLLVLVGHDFPDSEALLATRGAHLPEAETLYVGRWKVGVQVHWIEWGLRGSRGQG